MPDSEPTAEQAISPQSPCVACGEKQWKFLTRKHNHNVYRCLSCGTLSVSPLPVASEEIYDQEYFSGGEKGFGYVNYDADKEVMREVFMKYFRLLQRFGVTAGRLLDVGAATGYFVRLATAQGFTAQGVEISDFAAQAARRAGLDVQTGTLASSAFPNEHFRVITMLDVFEHVLHPNEDLRRAHALLATRGLLLLNTPDAGSLYARLLGPRWHLIIPPEHLHCFTRRGLRQMLERHGFSVVLMTTIGKRFTVEYVLHTLGKWLSVPLFLAGAKRLGNTRVGKWSLPINLRDNMFVIAQKR